MILLWCEYLPTILWSSTHLILIYYSLLFYHRHLFVIFSIVLIQYFYSSIIMLEFHYILILIDIALIDLLIIYFLVGTVGFGTICWYYSLLLSIVLSRLLFFGYFVTAFTWTGICWSLCFRVMIFSVIILESLSF